MTQPVLSVRNLRVEFPTRRAPLVAIDDVSFDILPGEVLGMVGESGAGKSVAGTAIVGLIEPPGRIAGGEIFLSGMRIDNLKPSAMRRIRGKHIGMVFQDPLTSLDPLYRIGQQLTETIATHTDLRPGEYVLLRVSDTGCGIPPHVLARVFEPFFTTKEQGKGTGLGLATVYGIVRQSGGQIWVYSELGRGSTFKVYFPNAERKIGIEAPPESETVLPRPEGTTILIVEDDELMRGLTRQLLVEHGYAVMEASDGKSALESLASHSGRIDLLLTDVVMRSMSGPELVSRVSESQPAVKVVFMSGYTGELIGEHDILKSGVALLEKPFTRSSLLKVVHAALAQGEPRT